MKEYKYKYQIICKICAKDFMAKVPFAMYCSRKCKRKAGYSKEYKKHPRTSTSFSVNCSFCGKILKREQNDIRHSKSGKFYCNKSCKSRAEVKKNRVLVKCAFCNLEIERTPSQLIKNGKKTDNYFCSRGCHGMYLRQFVGPKALHWKGGYNKTERTRIRSRLFWKELRTQVLELFDYKCKNCGSQTKLHIHHIIPYRLGGKDTFENLIPLCPKCHSKQTVKDWELEAGLDWKQFGAHTYRKESDQNEGYVQMQFW
jgi:5-methylcytosine-specific restriction endonuclease McrA